MPEETLPFVDLMLDTSAWASWSPREGIAPAFQVDPYGGPGGTVALALSGTGNPLACGCWRMALSGLQANRRYRLEAYFRTEGVATPSKCVRAIVTTETRGQREFYDHLDDDKKENGWHRVACTLTVPDPAPDFALNLFFAWSRSGSVRWGNARLFDVTGREENLPRNVRLAAVSGNPQQPASPAACIDFYAQHIDAIDGDIDLVCLPELINVAGVRGRSVDMAEPIPGPTSGRLAEKARDRGAYVAASILERQGEAIYNTGFLLDRTGGLVGKYRKTHLTLKEGLLNGCAPGNNFPVFHTDLGTLGYMVCYDGHYPEVPRLLGLQGVDVILFSNMGDGREGGALWDPVVQTRAIDNQVHIVAAVNGGRSCIVSPKGEFLAKTDKTPGATAVATCDLNASMCDFTKRPIHRRYDQLRRADLFDDLARHLWDD